MFKKLFSGAKKSPEIALIFDIGSDSVAGSIVHFSSNSRENPRIIYTKRSHWHSGSHSSYDDILRSMKYTLGNVARSIQEKGFPLSEKGSIYVTVSSPWFAHDMRRAELSRNTVFTVNEKILDSIRDKEMTEFDKESEDIYGEDFQVIEKTIVDISVNGYHTASPIGQKAKHVDVSIYISVAPKEVISIIEDTIGRVFHHKVQFQTSTLLTYVVSRDYFAKDKDYIFIDVGGELTDILVVRNNTIFQTLSFPLGTQFFYSNIAKILHASNHETLSLLSAFDKDALDKETTNAIQDAKKTSYLAYEKHLETSLRQLSKEYKLPQEVYISGFGFFEKDLKKLLESEHVGQYSMLEIPFDVSIVNETELHTMLRYQPGTKRDLFIALSALYRNHI